MSFFGYVVFFFLFCLFVWFTYKVIPPAAQLLAMRKGLRESTEFNQKFRIIMKKSIEKVEALEKENLALSKENAQLKQRIIFLENKEIPSERDG